MRGNGDATWLETLAILTTWVIWVGIALAVLLMVRMAYGATVVYHVTFTQPADCALIEHWEAITTALPAADPSQAVIADTIWPGAIGGCVSGVMTDVVSLPMGSQRVFLRACAPGEACSALSNAIDITGVVPTTTTTTTTVPVATTTTTTTHVLTPPSLLTVTP